MVKKLYVCRNCGHTFPDELSNLIESKTQVYCELCGTAFSLEGIKFKEAKLETDFKRKNEIKKPPSVSSGLLTSIKKFRYITWIPILVLSVILFLTGANIFIGLAGIIISLYDIVFISKKIKKEKLDEIVLDSIAFGILGCIIYGSGVLILLKGILILIYEINNSRNQPLYNFGLKFKNSFNNFSALGGFIIIIFSFHVIFIHFLKRDQIPLIYLSIFLPLSLSVIIIDLIFRNKIFKKIKFDLSDALSIIFLGIVGVTYSASGIFILLKGVIVFFLLLGTAPEVKEVSTIEKATIPYPPEYREPIAIAKEIDLREKQKQKEEITLPEVKKLVEQKILIKEPKEETKINLEKESDKKFELELHESLLPLKDEKDKKVVKEYFSKIFTVLSKDLRKQIKNLKIPKEEKRELLKELAFLSKEQQLKYIEALIELYKEVPIKLIEQIRKLPNVKPEHLVKIIDQLKFMDYEEQERYIQFLEKHA